MTVTHVVPALLVGSLLGVALWTGCGSSGGGDSCAPVDELCNGRDDDCDGVTDEGFTVGDDCTAGVGACVASGVNRCADDGAGVVCDAVAGTPVAEICNQLDDDCDGVTDQGLTGCCQPSSEQACGLASGVCVAGIQTCSAGGEWGLCLAGGEPVVLPGERTEACNAVDDDCDGATDEGFEVGTACSAGTGACLRSGIQRCAVDRTASECDAVAGAPSVEDCNGIDDNCDGTTDENLARPLCANQTGVCAGARRVCSLGSWSACGAAEYGQGYEAPEASCDGLDNDCDGATDETLGVTAYVDADADTWGAYASGQLVCAVPAGWVTRDGDCDDGRSAVHVGATEACNGYDDDCDGSTDEGFQVGAGCTAGVGACARSGNLQCSADGTRADCDAVAGTPSVEACNGLDDDCNGITDENLTGSLCANQMGVCAGARMACRSGSWGDCGAAEYGPSYEASETSCDGKDNDCDGSTDEGLGVTVYRDQDADTWGASSQSQLACAAPAGWVTRGADCDDANGAVSPGATELCGNGLDDDCDGLTDGQDRDPACI